MQLWELVSASAISCFRSKKLNFSHPRGSWNGPRGRPEFIHILLRVHELPEGHIRDSPGSDFLVVFCWFPISSSVVVVLPEKTATWFIALIVWGCCCCFGALILGRLVWSVLGLSGVLIVFPRGFAILFPFQGCAISLIARGCRGPKKKGGRPPPHLYMRVFTCTHRTAGSTLLSSS